MTRRGDRSARRATRPGTVLPLFAALLFVFLPLCALVIDLGLARLTRRQMQAGVNMAAAEGLRHRRPEGEPVGPINTILTELYRHGTGPVIDVSGGRVLGGTEFEAGGLVSVGSWRAQLLQNSDNAPYGDVVAGEFLGGVPHEEDDYARDDFDAGVGNNALLVRLRRTNAPVPEDNQPQVSSHGPGLSYLFFRGPYGAFESQDPRQQGLTVRATAIAAAQPALSVCRPIPEMPDYLGVAPCWISLESWIQESHDPNVAVNGRDFSGDFTGNFTTVENTTIGMSLVESDPSAISGERFVPLYEELSSGTRRVVGFGIAEFALAATGGTITKLQSRVALSNASSVLLISLDSLPLGEIDEVFEAWRSLLPSGSDPDDIDDLGLVLVPALRRTVP